jgi:hypothetical protein
MFKPASNGKKDEFVQEGPDVFPLMNGKRLEYIPFVFIGVDNTTPAVVEPPLVDLVYTNLSHYQSTADVEHGAHKTAMPQPWANGMRAPAAGAPGDNPQGAKAPTFYMGGGEIWLHPSETGQFGMLEYTGQGLEAIEKRLDKKEKHMAVLGARMLEDQKKEAETAETAAMHRSGEQSTLATQAKTAASGIRQALAWFDEWAGGTGGEAVEFALNDEFLPVAMTAQDLTALVSSWQQGAFTDQDLFDRLQSGGLIRDDKKFEEWDAQRATQPPRLSPGSNTPPGSGGPPANE